MSTDMKLSEELKERGFVYQTSTDDLSKMLDEEKRTVYLGIDPTAPSIHVGNLVPYMLLNHLLRADHKVILLMGGGTALIGDPGGKSEERPFVDVETVADQAEKMEAGVRRFMAKDITVVNNFDWLSKLSMLEFLRDVGKHFTVNSMIKKDLVANRLTEDNSISYTEFSYSLLQAYDYHHLHQEYGCDLQIGGSDQWGNIIAGVDYIRRRSGDEVYALTMPLVVDKATGKKFGKSEGNAIWLDPEKTTPYQFYQFWLNTSDESVGDYLKLFTFLELSDIASLMEGHEVEPGARKAQKKLAAVVTEFVHGAEAAVAAEKVTEVLFSGGDLSGLSSVERGVLLENAPTHEVATGDGILDILISSGLASSKREARTFIADGAVMWNDKKVTSEDFVADLSSADLVSLRRGKKRFAVLFKK